MPTPPGGRREPTRPWEPTSIRRATPCNGYPGTPGAVDPAPAAPGDTSLGMTIDDRACERPEGVPEGSGASTAMPLSPGPAPGDEAKKAGGTEAGAARGPTDDGEESPGMPSSPESSDNEMCTDISRSAPSPSSWAPGTDGTPEAGRRCPRWDILPRRLARTGPGLLSTSPQLRREAPRPEPGGSGSGNGGARWKVGRSHRGRASRGPCTAIKEGHSQGQWTSGHTSQECQGKRKSQRPTVGEIPGCQRVPRYETYHPPFRKATLVQPYGTGGCPRHHQLPHGAQGGWLHIRTQPTGQWPRHSWEPEGPRLPR